MVSTQLRMVHFFSLIISLLLCFVSSDQNAISIFSLPPDYCPETSTYTDSYSIMSFRTCNVTYENRVASIGWDLCNFHTNDEEDCRKRCLEDADCTCSAWFFVAHWSVPECFLKQLQGTAGGEYESGVSSGNCYDVQQLDASAPTMQETQAPALNQRRPTEPDPSPGPTTAPDPSPGPTTAPVHPSPRPTTAIVPSLGPTTQMETTILTVATDCNSPITLTLMEGGTVTVIDGPQYGSVAVGNGNVVTYVPSRDSPGVDDFVVQNGGEMARCRLTSYLWKFHTAPRRLTTEEFLPRQHG